MSLALDGIDFSSVQVGTTGTIDWTGKVQTGAPTGVKAGVAILRVLNETAWGIKVTLGAGRSDRMPAGGWGDFELRGENSIGYLVEYPVVGPSPNLLLATIYEPGERVPPLPTLGNSPIGVGGTVSTTTGNSIKNDGNVPGTSLIEATPSDQGSSATQDYNDGSGFRKILSAGVLRFFYNIVRGNSGVGKASVQIGDSGDTSITTLYGTVGAGSVVPGATVSGAVASASSVPGSGVTGDIAANQIGPGALDADVTMSAAEVQPGQFPAGAWSVVQTYDNPFIFNMTPNTNVNADLLQFSRLTNQPQQMLIGIDAGGSLYIYDSGFSAFILQAARGIANSASFGPIQTGRTAGGGNTGAVIWRGTTDPGGAAAEGDLWAGA